MFRDAFWERMLVARVKSSSVQIWNDERQAVGTERRRGRDASWESGSLLHLGRVFLHRLEVEEGNVDQVAAVHDGHQLPFHFVALAEAQHIPHLRVLETRISVLAFGRNEEKKQKTFAVNKSCGRKGPGEANLAVIA